ncbi:LIC_10572 family protein [Leptospira andrefontaineae]|uniref:DUF1566 domain-containing protein n=1 Tax=Leptospira andrefontaineae TaxID=2484976 RepID=A0A4R9H485_9LEPT|nr:DUF1566 domain-containing protein [Leptospira andrefontaineae]TGK39710.1 DUF1566 domain-containing protein [Leptospira andrefontaineae]
MANRRKPPRKTSGNKKQESSHKHPGGGNRGHQQKKRPDHGRSNRHQQHTVATKISETMKELPMKAPHQSGGSSGTLVKVIGFLAVALIVFFGYFIVQEYLDKTPVYGKHGWDEEAGSPVVWEDAVRYCSSRRKRLPDKEELKTFSKRADKKIKTIGLFWSTSAAGDKGDYMTVNLSSGDFSPSPSTNKFAVICVK